MPPEQEWEIWLDTHISPIIAKWMKEYTGYEVKSSYSLSLHEMTDIDIYQKARAQDKVILISKDADFPELISRLGAPPKLINIKIGNCDNRAMWDFLKSSIHQALAMPATDEIDIVDLE